MSAGCSYLQISNSCCGPDLILLSSLSFVFLANLSVTVSLAKKENFWEMLISFSDFLGRGVSTQIFGPADLPERRVKEKDKYVREINYNLRVALI